MKKIAWLGLLLWVSLSGCWNGAPTPENTSDSNMGGEANDPRWREKMLGNAVQVLQGIPDSRQPDEGRDAVNQSVQRLDTWIQDEPVPGAWQPDAMTEKWVAMLDTLDPVRLAVAEWVAKFGSGREAPKPADFAKIQETARAAREKITPDFPPVVQNLGKFLEGLLTVISQRTQTGQYDAEFLNNMGMAEGVFERLGVLSGTLEKRFRAPRLMEFSPEHPLRHAMLLDTEVLGELFLLRDVSLWAQGRPDASDRATDFETAGISDVSGIPNHVTISAEALDRVEAIFHWTVRNVVLPENEAERRLLKTPLEVLLTGRGTVLDRAWLFSLLARQQGMDVIFIETPASTGGRLFCGFVGTHGISLFDPEAGCAISGPDGTPVTWNQVRENPELLNAFQQKQGRKETFSAENLNAARAFVEASPWYVSLRMRVLQAWLTGKNQAVLTAEPTAIADRVKALGGLETLAVWSYPYEVRIWRAMDMQATSRLEMQIYLPFYCDLGGVFPMWRGRLLYLKGVLTGPLSATFYYQKARISDKELDRLAHSDDNPGPVYLDLLRRIRLDASYFLGNISEAVGNEPSAREYYEVHVLRSPLPDNPWKNTVQQRLEKGNP
ncbi:MAG: hypothetical protein Q4D98_01500 [Planctomycetia bacterium]|nr:hypothetical protein [Planctomycetia bacterium]